MQDANKVDDHADGGARHGFRAQRRKRVVFIARSAIAESAEPSEFFTNSQNDRAKEFLGKILHH